MNHPLKLVLALLSLTLTFQAQTSTVSEKKLNIFTLGDSNGTFPYSWPEQLKLALPNSDIYNISKSGRTIGFVNLADTSLNSIMVIDQNLKNAADHTKDRPFDFIIIELGTNDAKAIFDSHQQEVPINLGKLINAIKGCNYAAISKAKIIIISPPPYGAKTELQEKYVGGNKRVEEMSKAFKQVAEKRGCLFVNGYKTPGLDINTMTTDGLHLDVIGSKKLIEPVVELIKNK